MHRCTDYQRTYDGIRVFTAMHARRPTPLLTSCMVIATQLTASIRRKICCVFDKSN